MAALLNIRCNPYLSLDYIKYWCFLFVLLRNTDTRKLKYNIYLERPGRQIYEIISKMPEHRVDGSSCEGCGI